MNDKVEIRNAQFALRILLKTLKKINNYDWSSPISINKGRYHIIFGDKKKQQENILVIFKKETYKSFWQKFDLEEGTEGDSINVKDLQLSIQHNVKTIYRVFPDGSIGYIPLHDFLIKTNKTRWVNNKGRKLRTIDINEYKILGE